MLEALNVHNFQCLANVTVDFAPLTLLTGANGTGKSAVLRACLALRQSFLYDGFAAGLQLHGELIRLGTPDDVLYEDAREPGLDMTLKRRDDVRRYFFTHTPERFVFSRKSSLAAPFPEPMTWLGMERTRPSAACPIPTPMQQRYNRPGAAGQFIPYLLLRHGTEPVGPMNLAGRTSAEARAESPGLLEQTEAWLARLGHPVRIRVQECPVSDSISLLFSSVGGDRPFRVANAGSGLAHVLPVVVTVLDTQPGGLVWLEHPDAFMHPRAAQALGRFLALAVAHGVQIVVETHSVHLLNGLRLAVREGWLSPEDTALNYFLRDGREGETPGATRIQYPRLDADGSMDEWSADFFG